MNDSLSQQQRVGPPGLTGSSLGLVWTRVCSHYSVKHCIYLLQKSQLKMNEGHVDDSSCEGESELSYSEFLGAGNNEASVRLIVGRLLC